VTCLGHRVVGDSRTAQRLRVDDFQRPARPRRASGGRPDALGAGTRLPFPSEHPFHEAEREPLRTFDREASSGKRKNGTA
jgi:hypothetical protein